MASRLQSLAAFCTARITPVSNGKDPQLILAWLEGYHQCQVDAHLGMKARIAELEGTG